MNILNLLMKYNSSSVIIKEYFTKKMIESFEEDSNVPEQFIEFMREQGIIDEQLAKMLDVSPRALFDVFDDNGLYIQIEGDNKNGWSWEVASRIENAVCATRREAERNAVEAAFELLDTKIKQNEGHNSGTITEQIQEQE